MKQLTSESVLPQPPAEAPQGRKRLSRAVLFPLLVISLFLLMVWFVANQFYAHHSAEYQLVQIDGPLAPYLLTCAVLRVLPTFIILSLWLFSTNWPEHRGFRFIFTVFPGYIAVALITQSFWDYAVDNAPTPAIQLDFMNRDGANHVFAVFFGWLYATILFIVFELAWFGIRSIKRLCRTART